VTGTTAYRVRRPLTDTEMTAIRTAIDAAGSPAEILTATVHGLFTALLAPLGESLADYGADRTLDPGAYAIPRTQWEAIASTCTAKADAYGSRAQTALELINLMPATYDDPSVTVTPVPHTDHRPYEHVLTVSREATDVIAAATRRCDDLGRHFGAGSRQYQDAARSWQHNLARLFAMDFGTHIRITRDGDLSLLVCTDSGFSYGIIFHPDRRRCTRPGCTAVINNDGHALICQSDDPACPDGQHTPSYPLDAPQPGTWSFHS
jgi:hypothetical protein